MNLFAPKGLCAEVTEGIDLETKLMLTGQRVSIGSGPSDTLRLGAADVVPGHLTFERRADGKGWDYFTSDRGVTQIDKGNPRTGTVRAGMWIRLGRETRLDLSRAVLPAMPDGEKAVDAEPATIPMPVAIGILGAIVVGALMFSGALGGGSGETALRTAPWVTGERELSPAVENCLSETALLTRAIDPNDPASPFWRVMAFRNSDPQKASMAQKELSGRILAILSSAHLLHRENKELEASRTLRRLEYVLPVSAENCPILTASRFDLALLEVLGSR